MRPTVIMKSALTIDGQLAAADGTSQWITGPEAREDAHRYRAGVDAVMVGAGTVLVDDPLLNVRLAGYAGPQPIPVIVAGHRTLPVDRKVFARDPIVLAARAVDVPGRVLVAPDRDGGRVDLARGLEALYSQGIERVLVEGGPGLLTSLLQAGVIDRGIVYLGSKLAGGLGRGLFATEWSTLGAAHDVAYVDVRQVGADIRVEFEVVAGRTGAD